MELIRELTSLQAQRGCLSDEVLRELSSQSRVPLYRLQELVSFYPHFRTSPPRKWCVHVCRDVACCMAGEAAGPPPLLETLAGRQDVELHEVSCLGRCDTPPALSINDVPVAPLSLTDFDRLLAILDGAAPFPDDEPTAAPRCWKCDPYAGEGIERYSTARALIAQGMDVRQHCVEQLAAAGLVGMGGAGFPTARKWDAVANEGATPKYVICNADESEPGTFKDRVILEELPHLVIEGMLLGGLTISANEGIIFIRHEYTRERKALEAALADARAAGVLGIDAAGSGRPFDIQIFVSPGGYILGEESALLEALEDKRGEPRNRPPYPVQHGLWGKPTLVNNVESFALATSIVHFGADWWNSQGVGNSAGLKFVSCSGDVERPGVYEVPMGTTVSRLIELAGGMKQGKRLRAFLPGGASSNFLAANHADTPLDPKAMKAAGSMLGTGAVIVMAEGRDLFQLATNLVRFFRNESCGKCVPCRIGTQKAVSLLESAQAQPQAPADLSVLGELGLTLEQTSICGLGQVALNPILSMLKLFPDEVPWQSPKRPKRKPSPSA